MQNASDENVKCSGLDMRDKRDWDGTYPRFEATRRGFIVHLNTNSQMLGVFTDLVRAENAHKLYLGKIADADRKMAAKKAKKKAKKGK